MSDAAANLLEGAFETWEYAHLPDDASHSELRYARARRIVPALTRLIDGE